MKLRCDACKYNPNGSYCNKMRHPLEDGYVKFYYGGAIGNYGVDGKIKYPSRCNIEIERDWEQT